MLMMMMMNSRTDTRVANSRMIYIHNKTIAIVYDVNWMIYTPPVEAIDPPSQGATFGVTSRI